ncbi:methyltransferase [Streptomyces spiramenti]|uniref:Methyltransferase n=1 Tax=Streptomyces spiramenti TaxID=2720606 RepID=A0ABX1AMA0_9ACTN|nr:methyltransferase [Streptomyces spiramenti]NJP65502.1 methyltransferase [Streptomyces spiramenti]
MVDQSAARRVVDIVTGAWQSQALYAAVALGLPDHIAAGHTTDEKLAVATRASEDGIARLMRLLTAMEVFDGTGRDGYRQTAVSELLREGADQSMHDMVRLYGEEFHQAWGAVAPAIRTGTSGFTHAFGTTLHAYLRTQPDAGPKFQRAMNAGNVFFPDVLDAFDFSRLRTVVDVAGGSGALLATILRAHPHVYGVLFDQPHMLPTAGRHLATAADPDRYETRGGDIFREVPGGADAYLLSRVLQDWDDERCVQLLTTVRRATPDTSRLLILERVITEDGSHLLPLLWDLHLLMAAGGRERTGPQYEAVLHKAGFHLESTHPLALETSLLVAAPT